jgi:hypothetical protein
MTISGTWDSSPTLTPTTELKYYEWQMQASMSTAGAGEGDPPTNHTVNYVVSAGSVIPTGLTLDTNGLLYGRVEDMDLFVPEFQKPGGFHFDEVNYASFGSAKEGSKVFSFSVDAYTGDGAGLTLAQTHTILVRNNWSSDRDNFIREIDNNFCIDGSSVTNENYLTIMRDRGYYPDPYT